MILSHCFPFSVAVSGASSQRYFSTLPWSTVEVFVRFCRRGCVCNFKGFKHSEFVTLGNPCGLLITNTEKFDRWNRC
uniref:Uncharacterized protein n=1 Tax=Physcomitrium patens TaxID=3218 RepID=A0A7I3ZM43_PHYPA